MASVRIPKSFLYAILVVSRQLALSLDRSLFDDWGAFLDFFGDRERETYLAVLNRFSQMDEIDFDHTSEVHGLKDLTLISRIWSRACFFAGEHVWLPRNDLIFARSALQSGLQLIEPGARPTDSEITNTRMRLSECEAVFEQRVTANALRRAQAVEHFNSSLHFEHIPIDDLVDIESC